MSKGEIKTARDRLAEIGQIRTTRSGALRTLKFNATWSEFESAFGEFMKTDPEHPQHIILTDPTWQQAQNLTRPVPLDPKKYAEAAVSFVLGDESQPHIADYGGTYGTHLPIIGELGAKICESICLIHYPDQADNLVIYQAERSLLYKASEGTFTIFGQ